ncbi:hypothetical protein AA0116_g2972 [Alternaria tenuissima]|nr:hypothetical protein AA0116_g2972 [Alternaria tenuissima]
MAPALRAFALALRASSICPSSPTCPQDDQCSLTSNGATLQVSCATDYYGGDLQLAQTSTLAGCIRACSTTTGCNAASYVGGNCYLKSTLNAAQPNSNVIGVAVISRDTSPMPVPAPDTPKQCPASFTCPENDGCSYTDGSRTLTLTCGVDFYGGDFTNQYAASLEACTQACAGDTQCLAASFVGGKGDGRCYLKNTKNGGSVNDGVDAVYVVSNTVQPSSSASSSTLSCYH